MQNREVRQHEPLRVPDGWSGQSRAFVIQLERLLDDVYAKLGKAQTAEKQLSETLEEIARDRIVGKRTSAIIPGGTNEVTIHFPNGSICHVILSLPGINRTWVGLVYCSSTGVITIEQINSSTGLTVTSEENNYIIVSFSYSTDASFNMVATPYRNDIEPDIVVPRTRGLLMMNPSEDEEE